jgi:membrane protein DedA with SNARE-associated domain
MTVAITPTAVADFSNFNFKSYLLYSFICVFVSASLFIFIYYLGCECADE